VAKYSQSTFFRCINMRLQLHKFI